MTAPTEPATEPAMIDVRDAAALVGRHPETVRRWVWSGRLVARREGGRLLVARDDVEALARHQPAVLTLVQWAERARIARGTVRPGSGRTAADLVIEDRAARSGAQVARAGR